MRFEVLLSIPQSVSSAFPVELTYTPPPLSGVELHRIFTPLIDALPLISMPPPSHWEVFS